MKNPTQKHIILGLIRKLFYWLPEKTFASSNSWLWLRWYPSIKPTTELFTYWNNSSWEEYQRWLNINNLTNIESWDALHHQDCALSDPPKISIVTPVYNTSANILFECILSVRAQTYPFWQLVLIDDTSTLPETQQLLSSGVCKDPRIKIIRNQQNQGIVVSSNKAIEQTQGDYILFLDHDDRLSLDALHYMAHEISRYPTLDIVYADRDMLSDKGQRYLHLFKPDWSPETLLSGNYVFHPMCYKKSFMTQIGLLDEEFNGSQDFDLVLRAAEHNPVVRHIHRVLYHWRQHSQSVALNENSKEYAFAAGLNALKKAMRRRGLNAEVTEMKQLWRGHYHIHFNHSCHNQIQTINLDNSVCENQYTHFINQSVNEDTNKPYIAIIHNKIIPITENAIEGLASWLVIDKVGLVSGKLVNSQGLINYIGMALKQNGELITPYADFPESKPGYMAVTKIVRNISTPHPYCVLISKQLWQQLNGLDTNYQGPRALIDFALRAYSKGWRSIVVPYFSFMNDQVKLYDNNASDKQWFQSQWKNYLSQGDPYYNQNLAQNSQDMGLDI